MKQNTIYSKLLPQGVTTKVAPFLRFKSIRKIRKIHRKKIIKV